MTVKGPARKKMRRMTTATRARSGLPWGIISIRNAGNGDRGSVEAVSVVIQEVEFESN